MNQNDPDAARSLATPGDVLSLIGGAYNNWFYGNYSYYSAGMALSNAAFQHNAPWANAGMEKYGRLPRIAFINSISDGDYNYMTRSWFYSYRAIAAVADGLKSLDNPDVADALTADETAARPRRSASSSRACPTPPSRPSSTRASWWTRRRTWRRPRSRWPYNELMDVAMGYFDEAISLSQGASLDAGRRMDEGGAHRAGAGPGGPLHEGPLPGRERAERRLSARP